MNAPASLFHRLKHIGLAIAALSVAIASWAQTPNAVQSITGSMQDGFEVVRIDLNEPLGAVPSGFSIQTPARIALDLPGIDNHTGQTNIELNLNNLRSAQIVQVGERTRIVFNLKTATSYTTQLQDKSILLTLEPVVTGTATSANTQPPLFAETRQRDIQPLKDIDFHRSADGTGRIVVDLLSNQVGVDVRQQGQNLVVEFLKTTLPEGLRRNLDVSDFGTPVQNITTTQSGDKVRMLVEPKGSWEHSAYQNDRQFVLEVRPQKIDPSKLTQGGQYSGERLSLNFQNIETRALLQVMAEFTNFNIVASDSVTGTVTLRLKDVPWDQALDIVLQAKGLGLRKAGNVLLIAPKDELAAKDKLDLEAQNTIQGLEPVRTQSFQLNYAKAADIATQITAGGAGGGASSARILSARGSVIAEARTNQLFVTDIPSRLEQVQSLITKLDIPVRQVLIEARIVEAAESFGKSLGVRLGGAPATARGGALGSSYAVDSGGATTAAVTSGNFVNLPASGQNGFSAGSFAISLFNESRSRFLNLEISALEADGRGKVVSSPRVVTADQVKALIEQGTELPYQVATSSGATSLAFRKANLKLEVTPQITPEGNIILDIDVNKDSVGRSTAAGFAIDTKHIKTQVLVDNGGTVVIGGIFELNERDDETRVPFLGELPAVGNLFKTRTRSTSKSEILVFITPKTITHGAAVR